MRIRYGSDENEKKDSLFPFMNDTTTDTKLIGWAAVLVLPPIFYIFAHNQAMSLQGSLFVAIMAAVVLLWLFNLVDDYIPALVGMFASLFFGLAPPSVALSGMASPSLLTLMGVFALASVIAESGLSRRLVLYLMLKLPNRFFWQQNILVFCGLLLSWVSPSGNSRITLMLPLFQEISDALRLHKKGVSSTSLMVSTYGGSMLFSTALSNSKSASIAALSMLPLYLQQQYLGLFWLQAASVPIIVLLVIHMISVKLMFPNEAHHKITKENVQTQLQDLGRLTRREKIATFAFLFFFIGSITSELHYINVASIAGMTLVMLLIAGAFDKTGFQKSIDWAMIFFMLGMDSMMRTMNHLGLDEQLSTSVENLYAFVDGSFLLFTFAALLTTIVMRLAFPVAAGMILSFIILMPVTLAQGYSPWICIYLTAIFSEIWFFRYQNTVFLIAWNSPAVLDFDHAWFMRHNMIMNIARVACVLAAIPVWQWMGLI
jgi:di/tricarboxylate transporter